MNRARGSIATRQFAACVLFAASAIACSNGGQGNAAGGGAGGGSGQARDDAGHVASGSGGEQGMRDAGGGQNSGGASGSGTPSDAGSSGSGGGSGGSGACTAKCRSDQHCELVQVTCIRAPCPPQPMCVDDVASGNTCGSRGLAPCASGEFCNFPRSATCGDTDSPGTCTKQPQICQDIYKPVCGCDGQTYSNECTANAAGVSARSDGACATADAAGVGDCDPRKILCKRVAPTCPQGWVPSVSGSCYGPCVTVESCPCQGPEQCPQPDTYTCHLSAAHCGPFV